MLISTTNHPANKIITPEICMESNEIDMYQYEAIHNKKCGFISNVLGERKTTPYARSNMLPGFLNITSLNVVDPFTLSGDDIISLNLLIGWDDVYIGGETIIIG